MTIRVVFGEDSYLAREAILRVLEDEEDIDVVATCSVDQGEQLGDVIAMAPGQRCGQPDAVRVDDQVVPWNQRGRRGENDRSAARREERGCGRHLPLRSTSRAARGR